MANSKPIGMGLLRKAWDEVKLPADWCWAILFVHARWGFAPLPHRKCGAIEHIENRERQKLRERTDSLDLSSLVLSDNRP